MEMAKYTCAPYYEYPWVLGLTMTGSFCHTDATYLTYTLHNKRTLSLESECATAHPMPSGKDSNAMLFLDRYRTVVDELAPDQRTANRIKNQILIGALISTGGSLDWYKRAKPMKIWPQLCSLLSKADVWGLCFLICMQIFRIKPLRVLFRQRIY